VIARARGGHRGGMSLRRVLGVMGVVVVGAACGGSVLLGTPEDGGGPVNHSADAGGGPVSHPADAGGPVRHSADAGGGPVSHPADAGGPVSHSADAGGGPVSHPADAGVPPPQTKDSGVVSTGFDATILDSALPDASDSPIETFELIVNGVVLHPLSCPSSHWEFAPPSSATHVYLRNTGGVPLAYTANQGWQGGVVYPPGVPTGQSGELSGVLAPGASVNVTSAYHDGTVGDVGASKPFSVYGGGYAPQDEGTIPWPLGVSGSGGATNMYVAGINMDSSCSPVGPIW
jgi:hypothetical protein